MTDIDSKIDDISLRMQSRFNGLEKELNHITNMWSVILILAALPVIKDILFILQHGATSWMNY